MAQVNFSINYIENGVFKYRTLYETDVAELAFKNNAAMTY